MMNDEHDDDGIDARSQGTSLPVANHELKRAMSYVTCRKVGNGMVLLEDVVSYISISEAVMWKRFFPYSPLLTGELIPVQSI